jgi:hypothetical protein
MRLLLAMSIIDEPLMQSCSGTTKLVRALRKVLPTSLMQARDQIKEEISVTAAAVKMNLCLHTLPQYITNLDILILDCDSDAAMDGDDSSILSSRTSDTLSDPGRIQKLSNASTTH